MKKSELEELCSAMRDFITYLYNMADARMPEEDWNPEEASICIRNAIRHKARVEYANELLMARNTKEELEDLVSRMEEVNKVNNCSLVE